ncbi:MAG: sigma-54-dependent Fis family transcriptional regulator [Deltaproteobacteria bacterium]|nr:sigma-54-dependent Fis family transcriptional regulator [Deltaproteobacteria bacterium]
MKVLVVDDDSNTRYLIQVFCKDMSIDIVFASDGIEALDLIQGGNINLVVTDQRMPRMDGEQLLVRIKELNPEIPVLIMTSYGTIENAVKVFQLGAYDYITKPLEKEVFCSRLNNAIDKLKLTEEITSLRHNLKERSGLNHILGRSKVMLDIIDKIPVIAKTEASVVIYGESGTGKELVARAIHDLSPRATAPFVTVNCGALPDTLLESELFGYKKGAFTDARQDTPGLVTSANGGTLFLDEIGEASLNVQVKLLRFLQVKEYKPLGSTKTLKADVRIVTATNRDLKKSIEEGGFREDLYYRLNIIPIHLPPLRERKVDIPLLANHFLKRFAKIANRNMADFSPLAMQKLVTYSWPGNIRELENKVQQMVILSETDRILPEHVNPGEEEIYLIPAAQGETASHDNTQKTENEPQELDLLTRAFVLGGEDNLERAGNFKQEKRKVIESFEKIYLKTLLRRNNGNISRAAREAEMPRKNFWQKMKQYNIHNVNFKA